MALVLGITGGVGTGKSTVLKMLGELGAQVLSADDVAREVVAKGSAAYDEIRERFGEGAVAPNGEIDRTALAEIVFRDEQARRELERITHPRIIELMRERIEQFRGSAGKRRAVMAVEIPLLHECGLEAMVDEVLVVAAEQRTQMDRLRSRCGMTDAEAIRRIEAQMPLESKVGRADRVVWNDGDLKSLERSVARIWGEIILL